MKHLIIPNSALILYAKGWISFTAKHPDWDIQKQMAKIVEMCGYYPYNNPVCQVIMLFDRIVEFLKNWNEKHPDNFINIPIIALNIYNWETEVERDERIYNVDRNTTIYYTICSALSMLDIGNFFVKKITYDKHQDYTISSYSPGMTYKTMNLKFKNTFNFVE